MNALLVVDVQNDFCPNGALGVPGGDQIVPVVNKLADRFGIVILTQDWHPSAHSSFASSHSAKEAYETIDMPYGTQVLWPDHCVQDSKGSDFHPDLLTSKSQLIIRKGFRKDIDSYSAFFENDNTTPTGLTGYLRDRRVNTLYVVGLATDFCVRWSVLDGMKEGFEMHVVEDAVKGIDLDGSVEEAWKEMLDAGAQKTSSEKLLS
ncbi:MAG TPA: bifunctional nicotinamidase/pyrazinamidase [Fodinibius sp.]|nr:bifunctional nicotinamidase/pyrazinamidase [Fodinibius sp.]